MHRSAATTLALMMVMVACRTVSPAATPATPAATPATPATTVVISDRLCFGRSIPGGGTVSDAEWSAFVDSVITPRFPDGLTIWHAQGQWRDPAGLLVRETVMVLEVLHPVDSTSDRAVREIAEEYKRRFRQNAVLRATGEARIRLLD